jgi:excisionase family DNA binding protein
MKTHGPKPTRKEVELLIVEAFQSASHTVDAFERLTMAAWRHSLGNEEAVRAPKIAPEMEEHDGVLVCTIKEACRRTGLGHTRIYQAIRTGELRAMKCGQRTLIEMDGIRRWIASLPTFRRRQELDSE